MTPELQEALQVIQRVCAVHQGNLQEHQVIQHALALIMNELGVDALPVPETNGTKPPAKAGKA